MRVLSFFKIAYYRLFFFFFRMHKPSPFGGRNTDAVATVLAVLPFSAIWIANCFTLKNILERFIPVPTRMSIGVLFIIIFLNYLLFFNKRRYKRIKAMFMKEEKRTRHWRSFLCIVFCIVSLFGIVIIDAIFGRPLAG